MAFRDLREYIAALEKHDEAQRIEQEVDWNLEAGAIVRRTYELRLPAPFFQKVKGYPGFRMLGAPMSSHRRVAIAMGLDPDTPYRQLMAEYLNRKDKLIKPVLVKDAPCKENILLGDDVDVFKLPAPMIHEGDGGRYLCTWHLTITKDPDTGWVNWGMYRAMLLTRNTMTGRMEPHKHISYHFRRKYQPRGKPMPLAWAIGTEPVSTLTSLTAIPYEIPEVEVAGALRGEPVEMVKCETIDLEVPATSEIVIEAEVSPTETSLEGPFGEFTGYRASPRDRRPLHRIKAITYRNNAILTMSCMGVPIDDCHAPQSVTVGAEILALLRRQGFPVVDLCHYAECAVMLIVVSVKPTQANLAHRVAGCIWGSEPGQVVPYVIVVEDDIDPSNWAEVMHAMATKCHPYRGINRQEHATGAALFPFLNRYERLNYLGAGVYFDCTWPLDWDPSIAVPPRASFDKIYPKEVREHVLNNWAAYGFKAGLPQKKQKE